MNATSDYEMKILAAALLTTYGHLTPSDQGLVRSIQRDMKLNGFKVTRQDIAAILDRLHKKFKGYVK